ncbi:alpha/beta fold hydrolase [Noviherbaspirillum massiliense]|uniref:alpha/beta fold hydrolase n=1 Tax=Noviherbaspirillum massiliense TaxID=1465823 RepID=UPI001FE1B2D3|nr:alpha/beta hydrolase [Noviherbaspirillum massiliense]
MRKKSPYSKEAPHPWRNMMLAGTAVALASAALVVRRRTQQAERENPPAGQFIEVDGVRLHYVERGQGQPLVLLHGNGTMIQDFDVSGLLDLASENYRVIAFDRPGYGYSERPRTTLWTPTAQARLLHRALGRLGVEKAIVVGHSWGALVAVAMALEFPKDVRGLALLSGYYYPSMRLDVPLASPPAIPVIGDLMRYTVSPLLGRLMWPAILRRLFGPAPVPERFSAYPVWMSLRPSQLRASAAEAALMIPAAFRLRSRYHEIAMPVTIMAGADDRQVDPHRQSERLHAELPQSDLNLAPGAGHMIHHLVPHEVMAAIDAVASAVRTEGRRMPQLAYPAPGTLQ